MRRSLWCGRRAHENQQPQLVLITDPGPDPDDVKALLVCAVLHTQGAIRLRAVVANGGGEPKKRARLAKCVLGHVRVQDVPVGFGSVGTPYREQSHEFGLRGYDDITDADIVDGAKLLREAISDATPQSLTFVCISSLRDVADLISDDEDEFVRKVRMVAIQGGLERMSCRTAEDGWHGEDDVSRFDVDAWTPDSSVNNSFDTEAAKVAYRFCFARGVPMTVTSRNAVPMLPMQLARSFAMRDPANAMMRYLADAQFLGLEGLWQKLCQGRLPARCTKQWYFSTFCGVSADEFADHSYSSLSADADIIKHLNGFVKPYDVVALMTVLPGIAHQAFAEFPRVMVGGKSHLLLLTSAHTVDLRLVQTLLRDTYHEVIYRARDPEVLSDSRRKRYCAPRHGGGDSCSSPTLGRRVQEDRDNVGSPAIARLRKGVVGDAHTHGSCAAADGRRATGRSTARQASSTRLVSCGTRGGIMVPDAGVISSAAPSPPSTHKPSSARLSTNMDTAGEGFRARPLPPEQQLPVTRMVTVGDCRFLKFDSPSGSPVGVDGGGGGGEPARIDSAMVVGSQCSPPPSLAGTVSLMNPGVHGEPMKCTGSFSTRSPSTRDVATGGHADTFGGQADAFRTSCPLTLVDADRAPGERLPTSVIAELLDHSIRSMRQQRTRTSATAMKTAYTLAALTVLAGLGYWGWLIATTDLMLVLAYYRDRTFVMIYHTGVIFAGYGGLMSAMLALHPSDPVMRMRLFANAGKYTFYTLAVCYVVFFALAVAMSGQVPRLSKSGVLVVQLVYAPLAVGSFVSIGIAIGHNIQANQTSNRRLFNAIWHSVSIWLSTHSLLNYAYIATRWELGYFDDDPNYVRATVCIDPAVGFLTGTLLGSHQFRLRAHSWLTRAASRDLACGSGAFLAPIVGFGNTTMRIEAAGPSALVEEAMRCTLPVILEDETLKALGFGEALPSARTSTSTGNDSHNHSMHNSGNCQNTANGGGVDQAASANRYASCGGTASLSRLPKGPGHTPGTRPPVPPKRTVAKRWAHHQPQTPALAASAPSTAVSHAWTVVRRVVDAARQALLVRKRSRHVSAFSTAEDEVLVAVRERNLLQLDAMRSRESARDPPTGSSAGLWADRHQDVEPGGDVDWYIVHSWFDNPEHKAAELARAARVFEDEFGRRPRAWLDALCDDPGLRPVEQLAHVPVRLARAGALVVLWGPTLVERLWCVLELVLWRALGGSMEAVHVLPIKASTPPTTATATAAAAAGAANAGLSPPGAQADVPGVSTARPARAGDGSVGAIPKDAFSRRHSHLDGRGTSVVPVGTAPAVAETATAVGPGADSGGVPNTPGPARATTAPAEQCAGEGGVPNTPGPARATTARAEQCAGEGGVPNTPGPARATTAPAEQCAGEGGTLAAILRVGSQAVRRASCSGSATSSGASRRTSLFRTGPTPGAEAGNAANGGMGAGNAGGADGGGVADGSKADPTPGCAYDEVIASVDAFAVMWAQGRLPEISQAIVDAFDLASVGVVNEAVREYLPALIAAVQRERASQVEPGPTVDGQAHEVVKS